MPESIVCMEREHDHAILYIESKYSNPCCSQFFYDFRQCRGGGLVEYAQQSKLVIIKVYEWPGKDFSQYMLRAIVQFILQASLILILVTKFSSLFEVKLLDVLVSLSVDYSQ